MRKSWANRLPDVFGRRRIYKLERQLEEAQGEIEDMAAEMGVVSEDFEKDCWRSIKRILKRCEFDWRDVDHDGITADQAEEFIIETIDDLAARLKRATTPPETNTTVTEAAKRYLAAIDSEPENDIWDTWDGKPAEGALKTASDASWAYHGQQIEARLSELRAALTTEGQRNG